MKWFNKRMDFTSLWEEDGDLKRMKAFFSAIEADLKGREQVKHSVKQKALEIIAREEEGGIPVAGKNGLVQRMRAKLVVLSGHRRWKIGVSVIALALMVILGQGAMNSSWNILPRMGSTVKDVQMSQSLKIAPQEAGSIGVDGGSPSTKGAAVAPLPPVQAIVPPADAGIPRKITHYLTLTLEVATINDVVGKISREVQQQGGYVSESQQNGSDSHSSAQMTVKIPADKLNALRDSLATWGKVLDQHMLANDITNQYYDSQVRLQTLEAEEKRYLEILNQAKTVDDVLKVENALSNIRQQIEQLKGQLKLWNNQVDYSTVNLSLVTLQSPNVSVKNPWQPIAWSKTWQATQDAVLKTISSSWNIINYLVIGVGYTLPYLMTGALVWGGYRMWRKRNS
ncbi:MAG TPA: DUF4349 domain-containing protein [Desulfosporosinus sp.]